MTERARAAQAKESADGRKAAKRAGAAARASQLRTLAENEADLDRALAALAGFSPEVSAQLLAELDGPDPVTQYSVAGRAAGSVSGLPGWLRERCLQPDAERLVRDWLVFRDLLVAHKEFSMAENPLPQVYEALGYSDGQSLAVDGVAAHGRDACDRLLGVAFALRTAQRALVTRRIGTTTGYAASDQWRTFDLTNRFLTAELARWVLDDAPSDPLIVSEIVGGRFSSVETDPLAGRHSGISPNEVDEALFVAELKRGR
ncbi:hypothetical protein GCM10027029_03290 [Conyzicola lurida]